MADPFKHPRTGIYYIRRKVPRELKDALGLEFKRSLKTRDLSQAKAAFARAWAESEEVFALARANAAGGAPISIADAQQIAGRWFREEQSHMERDGAFDRMLAAGPGWSVETPNGPVEGQTYLTLQEGAAEWEIDPGEDWAAVVDPHIRRTLRDLKQPMPNDGASLARLRSAFAEHLHKLSAWALQRQEGQYVPPGQGVAPMRPLELESGKVREAAVLIAAES